MPGNCARKLCPKTVPGKCGRFFLSLPLTKDKSIIIGNRYQIDFSPDLPIARFPGNFRLFPVRRIPILMPSPLTALRHEHQRLVFNACPSNLEYEP